MLTLTLAIGANAVVFGVRSALVLRPLNQPRAASLYGIERSDSEDTVEAYPDCRVLRSRNRSFEGLLG